MNAIEAWNTRWPHFTDEEVLSPDGLKLWRQRGELVIDVAALDKLEAFRKHVGYRLICNTGKLRLRGYRSSRENDSIPDSAKFSFHLLGKAFDLSSPDVDVHQLYTDAVAFGWGGVGKYRSWVHVDNRPLIGIEVKKWSVK